MAAFLHPNFKKFKFIDCKSTRTIEHKAVADHIKCLLSGMDSCDVPKKKTKFDGKSLFLLKFINLF